MKNKGFTLIEILVVATIISFLFVSGLVSYQGFAKSSRDARRKADLQQISAALELYKNSSNNTTNSYPDANDFEINCSSDSGITLSGTTFLSKIPKDPKCDEYSYQYSPVNASGEACDSADSDNICSDYTLATSLENSSATQDCLTLSSETIIYTYCIGPYGEK